MFLSSTNNNNNNLALTYNIKKRLIKVENGVRPKRKKLKCLKQRASP